MTLGQVKQLTSEPGLEIEPAISPDGKFVAYAAGPLSTTRIYLRQPGGRPVALTADSGPPQRRPVWSPDGTRILFEADGDLFVMPVLSLKNVHVEPVNRYLQLHGIVLRAIPTKENALEQVGYFYTAKHEVRGIF